MKKACTLRKATIDDVDALTALEKVCFNTDRISRRQFRYLLTKGNAAILVAENGGQLIGYVVVLFSRATSMSRLYSIAVDPGQNRQGVGKALALAAEEAAVARKYISMRLEIRLDNQASRVLFESLGYRQFDRIHDYYEDHGEALRYEKSLAPKLKPDVRSTPFYQQTLDFTCGSAALMMAMKAQNQEVTMNRSEEIRLWREATTVFMTSGHGGCSPYGLALAAQRRGFRVEVYTNERGVLFINSVRNVEKKEVMRLVQEDMIAEMQSKGIPIHHRTARGAELKKVFSKGGVPLVLISSYAIYGEKNPHWVVANGYDEKFVYVHDPYVDTEAGETVIDSINMPIPWKNFNKMARYGRTGLTAEVIIYPQENKSINV